MYIVIHHRYPGREIKPLRRGELITASLHDAEAFADLYEKLNDDPGESDVRVHEVFDASIYVGKG
jgi:hypothetical protein